MKRFLSLLLCLACLVMPPAYAGEADPADYTVAGKLLKQLWAGSGFSGTLSVEVAAKEGTQAVSTLKPIEMDVSYIYVRPAAGETAEHRADLTLMENGNAQSAAHIQFKDGALAVQADILSPDWYTLAQPAGEPAGDAEGASLTSQAREALLAQTGMPSLAAFAAQAAVLSQNVDGLEDALESYLTRIDLWIEGYRQDAELGKLSDGTTTMEVRYDVPPAAIKSQAKQMILDLLSDQAALPRLQEALGRDTAQLMLNPNLQSFYFSAIDALPLASNLTIERTVSLKGDTLALRLSLPLYDAQGGRVTLRYDRTRGEGDLPDDNTISLESEMRAITLTYQEYSGMTGVRVIQGNFTSEARGTDAFTVDEDGQVGGQKTLSLFFSLKQQDSESKDDELRDVYTYEAALTLRSEGEGDAFVNVPETEATLTARFASKELKSAATDMEATATLGGAGWDQTVTLKAEGRSRQKWDPETLPAERVYVSQMTREDLNALLPGAGLRGAALLSGYLRVGPAATETPAPELTETPGVVPDRTPAANGESAGPPDTPAPEAKATLSPAP